MTVYNQLLEKHMKRLFSKNSLIAAFSNLLTKHASDIVIRNGKSLRFL